MFGPPAFVGVIVAVYLPATVSARAVESQNWETYVDVTVEVPVAVVLSLLAMCCLFRAQVGRSGRT